MKGKLIYLDYNASTPIAPEVADAMRPFLAECFGNPSSGHWAGAPSRLALERARAQVAALLACTSSEVVFTSGGSESNNAALKGVWFALGKPGSHFVTTKIEHPAISEPCRFLQSLGASVTQVGVDGLGRVDPEEIRRAITPRTILVSVMHANNEVGTVQPLAEIAAVCREKGVLFHTDAAQSVGKIPTRVDDLGVDLLTVAGHKLYAPKGVGALYLRNGTPFVPLVHGAGHERGRRAGTESVLLAAGLGAACALAGGDLGISRVKALRDRFWTGLQEIFGDRVVRNGDPEDNLPNTLHVSFLGLIGAEVLAWIPDVAASTGSACHAGEVHLSAVLEAMGVDREAGAGAVRWSLGRFTTEAELDEVLSGLRKTLSLWL